MRRLLSTRLSSQHLTPSARYVFNLFIQGSRHNILLRQLSILQCLFVTHPPTSYTTYFTHTLYCHTSIGNASESGARVPDFCARFLIFWLSFLTSISEIRLCKHPLAQALLDSRKAWQIGVLTQISDFLNLTLFQFTMRYVSSDSTFT